MAGVAVADGDMAAAGTVVAGAAVVGMVVAGVAADGTAAGAVHAFTADGVADGAAVGAALASMVAGARASTAARSFMAADASCAAGYLPRGAGACAGSIAASEQPDPFSFVCLNSEPVPAATRPGF